MKFRIDYIHPAPSIVVSTRIMEAANWSDAVKQTADMIDKGARITHIVRLPDHVEPTPWYD